jgi:hypothetical protein
MWQILAKNCSLSPKTALSISNNPRFSLKRVLQHMKTWVVADLR